MKEAKRWVEKAEKDLKTAKFNYRGKLFDVAAFFSQQTAEKALKAVYLKKFSKIKKIHDLVILGKEVGLPQKYIDLCKELTAAYIYTRYPEIPEEKDMKEISKEFIKSAEVVMSWTKKQLGK